MNYAELCIAIAVQLAARFEGFRSRPYLCPAGIPTIGYGATFYLNGIKVTLHDPAITQEYALELLTQSIRTVYLPTVLKLCPSLANESEVRLASVIDWTFNLGGKNLEISTMRKRINEGNFDQVPKEMLKWVKGGGRILKGLVLRRQAEATLFS